MPLWQLLENYTQLKALHSNLAKHCTYVTKSPYVFWSFAFFLSVTQDIFVITQTLHLYTCSVNETKNIPFVFNSVYNVNGKTLIYIGNRWTQALVKSGFRQNCNFMHLLFFWMLKFNFLNFGSFCKTPHKTTRISVQFSKDLYIQTNVELVSNIHDSRYRFSV